MMAKPHYWVKSGPANQIPSTKKYSQIPNTCSQRKPEEKQGKDEPERGGYFQSIGARDTGWEHFTHRTLSQVKDRTHKSPTILSEGTHTPNAKLKLPMMQGYKYVGHSGHISDESTDTESNTESIPDTKWKLSKTSLVRSIQHIGRSYRSRIKHMTRPSSP